MISLRHKEKLLKSRLVFPDFTTKGGHQERGSQFWGGEFLEGLRE